MSEFIIVVCKIAAAEKQAPIVHTTRATQGFLKAAISATAADTKASISASGINHASCMLNGRSGTGVLGFVEYGLDADVASEGSNFSRNSVIFEKTSYPLTSCSPAIGI